MNANEEDILDEVSTVCSESEQPTNFPFESLILAQKFDRIMKIFDQVLSAIKNLTKQEMEENYRKNALLLKTLLQQSS